MAPRIADLVDVTAAETVVRLDGSPGRLDELVLTGDVTRSLLAVLEAAQGPTGAGFLLVSELQRAARLKEGFGAKQSGN